MDASLALYHDRHQELRRLARAHEARLAPTVVREHPEVCLAGARDLIASVRAHLSMERTVLFPALSEAVDTEVRVAAKRLESSTEEVGNSLRRFSHHWTSAEAIRMAPEAFIETSTHLVQMLLRWIEVEEDRLFPLVDRT